MFSPMVSVCPRTPDFYVLLYELLQMYPDYVRENDLLNRVGSSLTVSVVKLDMHDRFVMSSAKSRARTFFDPCMAEEDQGSEICQFVVLLAGMADFLRYSYDKTYDGVRLYLYNAAKSRERPTLESLEKHFEDYYDYEIYSKRMPYSTTSDHYKTMLTLYSFFFPVFVDWDQTVLDVLRPLSDYVLPQSPTATLQPEDFAPFIAYLIDRNVLFERDQMEDTIDDISWLLANTLFELMGKYLGVEAADVETVINGISYNPYSYPAFGYYMSTVDLKVPYSHPCENVTTSPANATTTNDISDTCDVARKQADRNETRQCRWYCNNLLENVTLHQRARELLHMASYPTAGLQPNYPQVLLPLCQYPALEGDFEPTQCWRRIVNERGICYSAQTGKNLTYLASAGSGFVPI